MSNEHDTNDSVKDNSNIHDDSTHGNQGANHQEFQNETSHLNQNQLSFQQNTNFRKFGGHPTAGSRPFYMTDVKDTHRIKEGGFFNPAKECGGLTPSALQESTNLIPLPSGQHTLPEATDVDTELKHPTSTDNGDTFVNEYNSTPLDPSDNKVSATIATGRPKRTNVGPPRRLLGVYSDSWQVSSEEEDNISPRYNASSEGRSKNASRPRKVRNTSTTNPNISPFPPGIPPFTPMMFPNIIPGGSVGFQGPGMVPWNPYFAGMGRVMPPLRPIDLAPRQGMFLPQGKIKEEFYGIQDAINPLGFPGGTFGVRENASTNDIRTKVGMRSVMIGHLREQLVRCSDTLSRRERMPYCPVDGLEMIEGEGVNAASSGGAMANSPIFQKFGEDYYPESLIPVQYTWFQDDATVCRYVSDFVLYNGKGDRLTSLEQLGRTEVELIMFCKVRHVGSVHTVSDLLDAQHPVVKQIQSKRKHLQESDALIKIPRKQKSFASRIYICDWYVDVGIRSDDIPYIWVISDNDVYYRLDKPSGRFLNTFASSRILFEVTARLVKTLQKDGDKSFKEVLNSIIGGDATGTKSLGYGDDANESPVSSHVPKYTPWGALMHVEGSQQSDVDRHLDFLFLECRYHDIFFRKENGGAFMTELHNRLKNQLPFHYFDSQFMNVDYLSKNKLLTKHIDEFKIELLPELKVKPAVKTKPKLKRTGFDIDEYNSRHSCKGEVKSRSGRIIRSANLLARSAVVEPTPKKAHPQMTNAQYNEVYKKAAELEAKCDGLLLPFNFDWSLYNTSSEPDEEGLSTPLVLSNDIDIALNNARYYPRDIPLRMLKFYSTDDIIELCDLSRQFSTGTCESIPLLPKLNFDILESALIYTSSTDPYKPSEQSAFEFKRPTCICKNSYYQSMLHNTSVEQEFQNNYEDGTQWLYWLTKRDEQPGMLQGSPWHTDYVKYAQHNHIFTHLISIEYLDDLCNSSVDVYMISLLGSLCTRVSKCGFDWYIQELRDSGDLSDKKKELQERDLQIAVLDSELVRDFLWNNGGCMYRGRFRKFGAESELLLPYMNSLRWNKRFKKLLHVVSSSSNYKYSVISYTQDRDIVTISYMNRPMMCPMEILYPEDDCTFKTVYSVNVFDVLPTYRRELNVWKKESKTIKPVGNACLCSLNKCLKYAGLNVVVDEVLYDVEYVPLLGFGYREADDLMRSEILLNPDMLTDYTWSMLLRIYLFYSLYSCNYNYGFKLNSAVWNDPLGTGFNKSDDGDEEEEEEEDDADNEKEEEEGDEEKVKVGRRGWGLNRYFPYYDFEIQWYPDKERIKTLFQGHVSEESIMGIFDKLRKLVYYELDVRDRLNLLVWLGEILTYGPTGKAFIDSRNEEFFQLKGQLLKSNESMTAANNDVKKMPKRQRGIGREIAELEERYLQKSTFLGWDRFYNSYYYFGEDFGSRIFVQTLPNTRFNHARVAQRSKLIRLPSFGPDIFSFDLAEFAKRFVIERIFSSENRPKRGRTKKIKEEPEVEILDKDDEDDIVPAETVDTTPSLQPQQMPIKRKRSSKRRGKHVKPRLRRSREVFDRHPTSFANVTEYLNYLHTIPPRLCWCVLDDLKQLKLFLPQLSQFTTNERTLQLKLQTIEPDFGRIKYTNTVYRAPTPLGELLFSLSRGFYKFFKTTLTAINTCFLGDILNESIAGAMERSYKLALDCNKFINECLVEVTGLLRGNLKHCKTALIILLRLLLLFEYQCYKFTKDKNWSNVRHFWRREVEVVYKTFEKDFDIDFPTDRMPFLLTRAPGGLVNEQPGSGNTNVLIKKETPSGETADAPMKCSCETGSAMGVQDMRSLYKLVEKAGLLFRFVEVYTGDYALTKYLLPLNERIPVESRLFFLSSESSNKVVYLPGAALPTLTFLQNFTSKTNDADLLQFINMMKNYYDSAPTEAIDAKIRSIKIYKIEETGKSTPDKLVGENEEVTDTADQAEVVQEPADDSSQTLPEDSTPANTEVKEDGGEGVSESNPAAEEGTLQEGSEVPLVYYFVDMELESLGYGEDIGDDVIEQDVHTLDLVARLRNICKTLSKIEKTRGRKPTEDKTFTPRNTQAAPPQIFNLLIPILDSQRKEIHDFVVPHHIVNDSLDVIWRPSMRCRDRATGRAGTVRRVNYGGSDIWHCVSVEWHDSRNKPQLCNLWDIIPY